MRLTFARYITLSALTLLLMLPQSGLASRPIGGDYCGEAISGGEWVDVVTTLTTESNGLLTGTYRFDDRGEISPGTLREDEKQSEDTRTLVWVDKYGTGKLTMRFTPSRSSFDGEWGANDETPIFGWNGASCNFDSVRNSADYPAQS